MKVIYKLLSSFVLILCGASQILPQAQLNPNLSGEAKAYLESALNLMQQKALHRQSIDWEAVRKAAFARAAGAQTPAETYEAIRLALRQVNPHSFLQLSPELTAKEEDVKKAANQKQTSADSQSHSKASGQQQRPPSPFMSRREPEGHIHKSGDRVFVRVVVPMFVSDGADQFATRLQRIVSEMNAAHPCGWIVDLRGNAGGNMWPMLAGIGPVLGEGEVGAFLDSDGAKLKWVYKEGKAGILSPDGATEITAKVEGAPYRLRQMPPVAVLIDRGTASSGEAVAVAFRGRPNTRFFGEHSMGFSTANKGFLLSDGANMVLTTDVYLDCTGVEYDSGVSPDEQVAGSDKESHTQEGTVMDMAIKWLSKQSKCKTRKSTK